MGGTNITESGFLKAMGELKGKPTTMIVIVISCLVMLVGTAGNTLVLILVAKFKQLRTYSNAFVVVLAVADLNVCTLVMMLQIRMMVDPTSFLEDAGSNRFICVVLFLEPYEITGASLLALAGLTTERFIAVYFPFQHERWINKKSVTFILILSSLYAIIAGFSPAYNIPNLNMGTSLTMCPGIKMTTPTMLFTLYGVWIPALLTMTVLYGLITRAAVKQVRQINALSPQSGQNAASVLKSVKVFSHIALIMMFIWVPDIIVITVFFVCPSGCYRETLINIMVILYTLGNSLSAVNPWIYVLRNKSFRDCFDALCPICKRKRNRVIALTQTELTQGF